MFKQFSKNEKLFLFHNAIFLVPLSIIGVFVNFFIWEKTNSLGSIGLFQVFSAVGILIGAFIGTFMLNRATPNIVRAIGAGLTGVSIGMIAIFSSDISKFLVPSGLVFGLALGIRAQGYKILFMKIVDVQSREKFLTLDKLISSVASIIVPLVTTFLVTGKFGYAGVFVLMVIFFVISSIPLLIISGLSAKGGKTEISKALVEVKAQPDLKKMNFARIFQGIHIGIDNSVWSIIVLTIVGSLQGWGVMNTIFAFLSAIVSYTVGRKISFSNSKFFFSIMAIVFTLVGLFFAVNFDFISYLLFSFVSGIASNLFDTAFQSIEGKIKDRGIRDSEMIEEINLVEEFPLFIGRMLPFLFVLIINPSFEDDILLRIFIVVVSAVPLVISSILSNASVVRRSEDPFVRG